MTETSSIIDASKYRVQLLNEENYYICSNKLELILRGKGLWRILTGEETWQLEATSVEVLNEESPEQTTLNTTRTVPSESFIEVRKFERRKDTALTTILLTIEDT